jgi:lantibiotic modifying enzyme
VARRLEGDGELECGLGGGSGLGALADALVHVGHQLKDAGPIELARRAARRITAERVQGTTEFDVTDGLAGALLGLLTLLGETGAAQERDRAIECGERLLALQEETQNGGGAWATSDGRRLGGFAHGAAGASLSLARLAALTGEPAFAEGARRAVKYEASLFSPTERNWLLLREGGGSLLLCSWCHGAAGIALARILSVEFLEDPAFLEDARVGADTTRAARPSVYDHVCCGQLGRAETLLTVGLKTGERGLVEAGRAIALGIAGRVLEQGRRGARTVDYEAGAFRPGFFQGLAGIGYQFLRTADPEQVPSILGYEAPGEAA